MRIQKKSEEKIINYYRYKRLIKRLEYEIGLLEKTNVDLEKCKFEDNKIDIENKVENNKRKIIDKRIKLNEIINENINVESFLVTLNKDDKELCELRYNKELGYQEIGRVLHISNSTISRRINNILRSISK